MGHNSQPDTPSKPIDPAARKPNRITTRQLMSACTLVLALGMLIWLKLRLVANVPRTAYAQPAQHVEQPPASASTPHQGGHEPTPPAR